MQQVITKIVEQAISDHIFPGCVVGYSVAGGRTILAYGKLTYADDSPAVTTKTVYDLASVTKSVATTTLILKLLDSGKLHLDDLVSVYLPEINGRYTDEITIEHLLTYTAIFDQKERLSHVAQQQHDLFRYLLNLGLIAKPGTQHRYENAPMLLLGHIVEKISGSSLDRLAQREIFDPLGMANTTFFAQNMASEKIAPTEIDWRGEVRYDPHDESAYALRRHGIVAGHAGLVSDTNDLLTFMNVMLNDGKYMNKQLISQDLASRATSNQLHFGSERHGFGWEIDDNYFTNNDKTSEIFGKTGFTGCSVCADKESGTALVFLSNRTYPQRPLERAPFTAVRKQIADVVFSL